MKLTTFILIITLMQVSAATFGQRLSLKQNNVTMDQVFREIRKQTGYDVLMNITRYKNTTINANFQNTPLEEVMDQLTKNKDLEYTIEDKTVVIKEKEPSFLDKVTAYFASISVRGSVVDENGQPMAGVTVSVKNGKATVSTDSYGGFYLKSVDENAVLIFSFLGYVSQEILVDGRDGLGVIKMKLSESKLDEVQIQAYGKTSRRLSTSTITTIKAEDIVKQPVDNPLYALMGRVPGLIITQVSGMQNAPVKVQLRGQNSLSDVDTEPLFVIDGIPALNNMTGGQMLNQYGTFLPGGPRSQVSVLSHLNPNDIESIDVLKDADATSIYGSRGANGVILITTKKARVGETKITGSFGVSFSYVGDKYPLMNTQQYLAMRKEAYVSDGLPVPDANIPGSQKNSSNFDLTVWDQNRYTDWQKELLGGIAKNYNVDASITGGSPAVQYVISGNYNRSGYVFPGDAKAINGGGRASISGNSPNNKFKSNLSVSYTGSTSTAPIDFSRLAYRLSPNAPAIYNANGDLNWEPNTGSVRGEATWTNPFAQLLKPIETQTNNLQVSLGTSYEIISALNFRVQTGLSKNDFHGFTTYPIAAVDPVVQNTTKGRAITQNNTAGTFSVEPQLDYVKNLLGGRLSLLIGGSYQGGNESTQMISQGNYDSDALLRSLNFGTPVLATSSNFQYRYMALFSRVNYDWKNKYILNLTARRDGSSKYGPGHQFGDFGSVGLAWIFSNEDFLKKQQSILSFGKIRATYGTNGNDAISAYKYIQLFSADAGTKYQNANVLIPAGPVNSDFHWETKHSLELGLDLGFFNDRLYFSGAYFRARSSEQLLENALPYTAGIGSIVVNDGSTKIQNTGFEISVNSRNISGDNFKWTTDFNISFLNKNKILAGQGYLPARLAGLYNPADYRIEDLVGKPFAGIKATYEYRGIDQNTGAYQFTAADGGTATLQFALNPFAKLIDVNPKYTGGISNQFSYKGLTLDVFMQFTKQIGKSPIFNLQDGTLPGMINSNQPIEFADYWLPGKNSLQQRLVSGFASPSYNDVSNGYSSIVNSDVSWVDASFLRFKNVAISYQFPNSMTRRLKLNSLRFGLSAQNLLTITGYKGLDPESQSIGSLPPLRTVAFNIQIGL